MPQQEKAVSNPTGVLPASRALGALETVTAIWVANVTRAPGEEGATEGRSRQAGQRRATSAAGLVTVPEVQMEGGEVLEAGAPMAGRRGSGCREKKTLPSEGLGRI